MPDRDDARDTALLVAGVREAGAIARRFFDGAYKSWRKSSGDPVTEADIAVDEFLQKTLLTACPAYGWLSEETNDDGTRLSAKRVFIVDPIDGTAGFLKHRPQFTVVAAVVVAGRPVAGVIYNPITEEMFEATRGSGAKLNSEPIHAGVLTDFGGAGILAGRDLMEPARWKTPWPGSVIVETRASVAYRMALVAAGTFDAMISLSTKADWDLAAGDLIVHESGGLVTTAEGSPLAYNQTAPRQGSVIAAGPVLHGRLVERMRDLKAGPSDTN